MNIFLIGYRGTGKTAVGKILAEKRKQDFIDADLALEKENDISISEMVAEHGWGYFRQKERETLIRLCKGDHQIIATGGGVILNPENIRIMRENGKVIWLKASAETVTSRILKDEKTASQRPALTDKGVMDEIEETLSFRRPLYEKAADFSVDTDGMGLKTICKSLMEKIGGDPVHQGIQPAVPFQGSESENSDP